MVPKWPVEGLRKCLTGVRAMMVRNERLTMVTQKLNDMPTDSIVQLCVQCYDEEAIDAANLLLHESSI